MNRTKLLIIEGIPGSGKTTTAHFVAGWLGAHGFAARIHLEGDLEQGAIAAQIGQISQARVAQFLAEQAG